MPCGSCLTARPFALHANVAPGVVDDVLLFSPCERVGHVDNLSKSVVGVCRRRLFVGEDYM